MDQNVIKINGPKCNQNKKIYGPNWDSNNDLTRVTLIDLTHGTILTWHVAWIILKKIKKIKKINKR